ncbi:MAG: hypothetical protein E7244_23800 [Enterocloster citroniae]|uniref:hypothetical protein n=1 Tax=Enterocloster aldenensis TaxID=358742 RepID=UPI002057FEB3|nr:hypothetical protein [Enterocloster citroniae]MDM8295064.1 hypothetical protein [Enterocloster aldenensis]DAG76366.1 MAG TPA: hypothetical protein [Caudoviricetes sp.]
MWISKKKWDLLQTDVIATRGEVEEMSKLLGIPFFNRITGKQEVPEGRNAHVAAELLRQAADALENNFSFLEGSALVEAGAMLWAFEKDEKTGSITVIPMNGNQMVIHGKEEAEMFCGILTGCFQ